jgi:hypothetical protein
MIDTRKRALLVSVALVMFGVVSAHAQCPPGDLNEDCVVDEADLLLLARSWLSPAPTPADLNADECVDGNDLALLASHWRATGCPVVINEILAHSHAQAPDWIELHNVSSVPVDIGGWTLSDKEDEPDKYTISSGTQIRPGDYAIFYENIHFGNPFDPGARTPFALSENGEALYLGSGGDPVFGGCLSAETFGASETGTTFGRYLKSDGTYAFVTLSWPTPLAANADALVGPLVINEIMYHPTLDDDAEYVELLNISRGLITLFDFTTNEPWRFTDDAGIDFWFPSDVPVTVQGNEHILLARDAAAVRRRGVPANVQVFEWGSGRLDNRGETIRLLKPGDVDDAGTRYWIDVDHVAYSDGSQGDEFPDGIDPWPSEADGLGLSLNRVFPSRYGDDPANWHATIPTPGSTND